MKSKKETKPSYIKNFSNKLKRNLKKVSNTYARKFLTKEGYIASSFTMPEYYKPGGFDLVKLERILWNKNSLPKLTKTLNVVTPKGPLSWRNFNFLNPYIFLHIVSELTQKKHWSLITNILSKENLVYSYSVPVFDLKSTIKDEAISNWIQLTEKDIIKDSLDYSYLTTTDIKNFYPSIYTHGIAWATNTKSKIKQDRYNLSLLGNRLDKLFQNSSDGQTNGIPVGSMVSDIVAEIILSDIDNKLSKTIIKDKLLDQVLVCRYRDDYRILSNTSDQGKRVLQNLNKILYAEYNLHINASKTDTHDDIIEYSFRPWILKVKNSHLLRRIVIEDYTDYENTNYLKDCLLEIYRVQKEFPNGRVSATILNKLARGLSKSSKKLKLENAEIPEIISILRKITLLKEEVTPQVMYLLDILLKFIKKDAEKIKILTAIKKTIDGKSDHEYQLIWFYRLCLSHSPKMAKGLLKNNEVSLLRILSRRYYKNDYEIFDNTNISIKDQKELEKFVFVDREKLKTSEGLAIIPEVINLRGLTKY